MAELTGFNDEPFKILIVDDNPNNLFTLASVLRKLDNCAIIQAESGDAALAATIENSIDLILLDVQMPGMNGYITAKHLKMTTRTRDIPIIFITAVYKSEEFIKHGYEVGAIDYLTKPLDDNQLLNRISLHRKVFEREMALQEALKTLQFKSRERFRSYFERAMVGMAIVDLDKRWQEVNDALCQILGYSREELINVTWPELVYPNDQKLDEDCHSSLLSGETDNYTIELRFVHKKGVIIYTRFAVRGVYNEQGDLDYLSVMVVDITETRQLEAAVLQSKKMSSIGVLAAGMAHEINNPLSGVLQGIQNIKRRFSQDVIKNVESAETFGIDLEKVHAYMDQRGVLKFMDGILDSGKRIAHIVSGLQALNAPKEARVPIDLNTIIKNTVSQIIEESAQNSGNIDIESDLDKALPKVPCIAEEIRRTLFNVIHNASESIGETEQTGKIIVRSKLDGDMALIEVEDSGCGIEKSELEKIFEPFYTTSSPQRKGLGLSIAYFLIHDLHEGKIWAESEPGKGTSIYILLPLA